MKLSTFLVLFINLFNYFYDSIQCSHGSRVCRFYIIQRRDQIYRASCDPDYKSATQYQLMFESLFGNPTILNPHHRESFPSVRIKGVVYLRGFKNSNFFFFLISNLDIIRNMPYEGFIRKHAGSNTTDLIIYL